MKKSILLLLTFFSFLSISAQNIEWGPLEKTRNWFTSILPVTGSTFFAIHYSGRVFLGSPYLELHSNFSKLREEKLVETVNGNSASFVAFSRINSQIVVFLSVKQDGQNKLFMQKYNDLCLPEGSPILVAEYTIPKGWRKDGYFRVIQSQNVKFLCLEYSIPATKEDNERFGFKIINENFGTVSEGEYESSYGTSQSSISNRYLSNTGDYFIAAKVYNLNKRGNVMDVTSLEKIILMHITPGGIDSFDLDLGDKYVTDIIFSSDDNRLLTCTGLYGTTKLGATTIRGISGIFYFQLDFTKKKIIHENFDEFKKDFITEGWTDNQKEKADKKEARGKDAPAFYNYDIKEAITLKDGSLLVVMEEYFLHVSSTYDPKTHTTTRSYEYRYDDIIVYKVTPEGKFSWTKKIMKRQSSTNDGGYFSSIAKYITDDKLVIFFNDNLKNYDATGQFLNPAERYLIQYADVSKKLNCFAKVEMNLESGESTRSTFFSRAERGAVAVPKFFNVDYNNKEMLMVLSTNNKEQFGLLKF